MPSISSKRRIEKQRCFLRIRTLTIGLVLLSTVSCTRTDPAVESRAVDRPSTTHPAQTQRHDGARGAARSTARTNQEPARRASESSATTLPSVGASNPLITQSDREGHDRTEPSGPVGAKAPAELPLVASAQLVGTGIRRLDGNHLVLYTDLPSMPQVDELPHVFDLAVPQWCAYFKKGVEQVATWKMVGYLMKDSKLFRGAGMLPDRLPPFRHGYQTGTQMWMYEQPSDYYRRHMLLHEGTHAFMNWQVGGCGPPWYGEGMAELFATHTWQGGQLQLGTFPRRREDVPDWGRIKIVRDDVAAGRALTLAQIMNYGPHAHLQTGPYGWCWAACALLDGNPQFQARFRQLWRHVDLDTLAFADTFNRLFAPDRQSLDEQWQLFEHRIDYGYDIAREAVVFTETRPLPDMGVGNVVIRADRGWQSTGFELRAGSVYSFTAAGRYQIAKTSRVWWCEPDGVTIRYYAGQPLGRLLAAVVSPAWSPSQLTSFARPRAIGSHGEITCPHGGTLYLRVNDSPSELADNAGQLRVVIRQVR